VIIRGFLTPCYYRDITLCNILLSYGITSLKFANFSQFFKFHAVGAILSDQFIYFVHVVEMLFWFIIFEREVSCFARNDRLAGTR
jgi:hypothetical protein